jgi:hypothetical protein
MEIEGKSGICVFESAREDNKSRLANLSGEDGFGTISRPAV